MIEFQNQKIIIANWKNNPATIAAARELFAFAVAEAGKYPKIKTVICPPIKFLRDLLEHPETGNDKPETFSLGAQDVFWPRQNQAPFGIKYALIGHSDRRYQLNESDEIINQKIKIALESGAVPIVLVGERNKDDDRKAAIEKQLTADLIGLNTEAIGKILFAYEPVWSISTNPNSEPDKPENTLLVLQIIRQITGAEQILYGGSITEKNVAEFLVHPEICGVVIGAASLRQEEFANILRVVSKL